MPKTTAINNIIYDKDTVNFLVEKLGGIEAIKAKLKTDLLFGEKLYLERVALAYSTLNGCKEEVSLAILDYSESYE